MATFVLIHGAGDDSWYWHLVVPELRAKGHNIVAPDLPCHDTAGLKEYADAVVEAVGDRTDLVVVAQSFGGFTAPLVCQRLPVDLMVLVAGMIPSPGETPGDWWANTGYSDAKREQAKREGRSPEAEFDVVYEFLHDVPPDVVEKVLAREERSQSDEPFKKPWPLDSWPDVPTRFLLCRDDHFFPAPFMRRVVSERLGIVPDEIDGSHVPALARPKELADRLDSFLIRR